MCASESGSLRFSLSLWERVGVRATAARHSNARAPHIVCANNSRPISMRRISLVPAPIS